MPLPCPIGLQTHPLLLDRWPVASDVHRSLRGEVPSALRNEGHAPVLDENAIRGDFMGGSLRVPSLPRADFLWAGLGSLIVSSRVRALLLDFAADAIATAPARLVKTGRAEVPLPPPEGLPDDLLDQLGVEEPEDLTEKLAVEEPGADIGPYFEVVVRRSSERPPGAEITSVCAECGREEFDKATRRLALTPAMWRGDAIFLPATTLQIMVTDDLRDAFVKMGATNVRFVPIGSETC